MTAAQRGRRNRAKGQAYERRIRDQLAEALPGSTWKRRVQFRGGRVDGSDVEGQDAQGNVIPLWVEAHNGNQSPAVKLAQACDDAPIGWYPVAIIHRPRTNYDSDTAHLRLGDLLELAGCPEGWITEAEQDLPVSTPLSAFLHLAERWYRRIK
jgi:hypothetical protein